MRTDLLNARWQVEGAAAGAATRVVNGRLSVTNEGPETASFVTTVRAWSHTRRLRVSLAGQSTSQGASLRVNDRNVPLNATALVSVHPGEQLTLKLIAASGTSTLIDTVGFESTSQSSFVDDFGHDASVLVVTPDYPSSENLYLCGFVHARVREYLRQGVKVVVASVGDHNLAQTVYEHEGVRVWRARPADLAELLKRRKFDTCVVHFIDDAMFKVFDEVPTRLICIVHGPETVFEYLPNRVRPYFSPEVTVTPEMRQWYAARRFFLRRFSQREHVHWVFVSKWLKDYSEELLGFTFKNAHVIHNVINERVFPYVEKQPELRKQILIIRKFDNISQHAIDQSVLAIRELSRRPFFGELTFNVYGDGNFMDELLAPLREFANVHVHRRFLRHEEIREIHREHGVLLLPSRHDAHAVSMSEGASSGLVVVGSNVTSNGDFMNVRENRTMAEPENFVELADIIERLYRNPDEFQAISRRMSAEIRARCSVEETATREVRLIQAPATSAARAPVVRDGPPVLSVVVPAYNLENILPKCLFSLVDHRNAHRLEVLVVNDGSKDQTSRVAHEYAARFPGVIRVFDTENGGHGATINLGFEKATGRYTRLVDGDDWVDSAALAEQIDHLATETADLVLTDAVYERKGEVGFTPVVTYGALRPNVRYWFDDLTFPSYGFAGYGPTLPTSTFRTERLRAANFKLDHHCAYVDQQLNAFVLSSIDTLVYDPLDVYRYFIGREGQTVSRAAWTTKYKDHLRVTMSIAKFVTDGRLNEAKRRYVVRHILAPLVDWQIIMFDHLQRWAELGQFLEQLSAFPEVERVCLDFVRSRRGDGERILANYRQRLRGRGRKKPIAESPRRRPLPALTVKKLAKGLMPYGLLRLYAMMKER